MKKEFFFFALILILASSCSTNTQLKYDMSNHKFMTPETKGEFLKGDVSLSLNQKTEVVIAEATDDEMSSSPPIVTIPMSVTSDASSELPISLGLLKWLDFYSIVNSKYGVKVQFFGASENENTAGYKAAFAFAYGYKKTSESNQTSHHSSIRTYEADMRLTSYDVCFLFGYRLSERKLVYSNIFRDNYKYQGSLQSNQFATINASGKSYNQGGVVGLQITHGGRNHHFINKFEIGIVNAKLDNRIARTMPTFGAELGWNW